MENTPEGVLLKPEPAFVEIRPEDVFGRLVCDGPPKSLADMQAAFWPKPGGGMRGVDTKVVVRYLTGDEPEQAARARAAIDAGDIFVSTTVLLALR